MGYYSWGSGEFIFDEAEFTQYLRYLKNRGELGGFDPARPDAEVTPESWFKINYLYYSGGYIELESGKWYNIEDDFKLVAPVVEFDVEMQGEDGEKWGFKSDKKKFTPFYGRTVWDQGTPQDLPDVPTNLVDNTPRPDPNTVF